MFLLSKCLFYIKSLYLRSACFSLPRRARFNTTGFMSNPWSNDLHMVRTPYVATQTLHRPLVEEARYMP
jgi:hypothetical protein